MFEAHGGQLTRRANFRIDPLTQRVDLSLGKKWPYLLLFSSAFSRIRTEYGDTRSISPYSVQMRGNPGQNNSEYEHFSRSISKLRLTLF